MTVVPAGDPRRLWVTRAKQLDSKGHFAGYATKRRREVLKKGFLGEWPPDRAIVIASRHVELGYEWRTPKFVNEMRDHFGLVGDDIRYALLEIPGRGPSRVVRTPSRTRGPARVPFHFSL